MKGLRRNLLLTLLGLVIVSFAFESAFGQELKGQEAFLSESLKAFVPLMVGLGVGLAVFIVVSATKSR